VPLHSGLAASPQGGRFFCGGGGGRVAVQASRRARDSKNQLRLENMGSPPWRPSANQDRVTRAGGSSTRGRGGPTRSTARRLARRSAGRSRRPSRRRRGVGGGYRRRNAATKSTPSSRSASRARQPRRKAPSPGMRPTTSHRPTSVLPGPVHFPPRPRRDAKLRRRRAVPRRLAPRTHGEGPRGAMRQLRRGWWCVRRGGQPLRLRDGGAGMRALKPRHRLSSAGP
jgi:hypothetical protein